MSSQSVDETKLASLKAMFDREHRVATDPKPVETPADPPVDPATEMGNAAVGESRPAISCPRVGVQTGAT